MMYTVMILYTACIHVPMETHQWKAVKVRKISDVKQNTKVQLHGKLHRQLTEVACLFCSPKYGPRSFLSISVRNSAA